MSTDLPDTSGAKPAVPAPSASYTLQTALNAVAETFTEESRRLRIDVHAAEEARRRASRINIGLLVLLSALVALLLMVTWQNNLLARDVRKSSDSIADCTTAGGKCYEQSGRRTGNAIADIIKAQVYVAQCSRLRPGQSGPVFDKEIEQCVAERLAAADKARKPQPGPSPAVSPGG